MKVLNIIKKNKNVVIAIAIFIFMLTLDIISKNLAHQYIAMYDTISIIPHLFNFTHVHNTGGAFSLGSGNLAVRIIFCAITIIAIVGIVYGLIKYGKKSIFLSISLGLMMTGALGNLIDRLFVGYVDDFIQFDFWQSFAIFNVADIAITFGVIFFAIYIIFIYKEEPKKKDKEEKI